MPIPSAHQGTNYLNFVPELVTHVGAKSYIEVGVNAGELLSRVAVNKAIGIDPAFVLQRNVASGKQSLLLAQLSSDEFFADVATIHHFLNGKVDIAFLDGMHRYEFLLRDFINTERFCNRNSIIIMHDCLPLDEAMTHRDQAVADRLTQPGQPFYGWWTGDVWKIIPILRKYRPDLDIRYVDCHPTGVVCVTKLDPVSPALKHSYDEIIEEFDSLPSDIRGLEKLYATIELISPQDYLAVMPRI